MRLATILVCIAFAVPNHASQPGQPLDCSDWVIVKPGITCRNIISWGGCWRLSTDLVTREQIPLCNSGVTAAADNEDGFVVVEWGYDYARSLCATRPPGRTQLVRYDQNGTREVIAVIEDRCPGAPFFDVQEPAVRPGGNNGLFVFSDKAGRVMLPMRSECLSVDSARPCPADYDGDGTVEGPGDVGHLWVAEFSGFTTAFDILQSFHPNGGSIGFRTPYMPEGMNGADHFDTYWGAVSQPLDLANAHPFQCGYPTMPPSVGDNLQITAPVPTPAPGNANYVLTSVTYQGQTRAGRKASGGKLSGRDASRLPACVTE